MNIEELFGKDYSPFCEVDPFNPKNTVEGYISRKPNEYYGALVITKVNNQNIQSQFIVGTPKMHYPFDARADGTRNYRFPSAKSIEVYEKLDGTNVLAYFYYSNGKRYLTYKTRLRPFLASGKFGNFYAMWKEMLEKYDEKAIKNEMIKHNCNLSFELYGNRNPHLVLYDTPLDIALLFGVTNEGKIISPRKMGINTLPTVNCFDVIDKDYVWNYESLQKRLNSGLKMVEDEKYRGVEGAVWYLHTLDNRCVQLKCKPEIIEAIYWSQGVGISKNSILATCWNAFENTDELTIKFIKQLLLEEFPAEKIEANHYLIEKCIDIVTNEAQFRARVLEAYKATGMNILLQKIDVMRQLSRQFPKDKMKKVYSVIVNN